MKAPAALRFHTCSCRHSLLGHCGSMGTPETVCYISPRCCTLQPTNHQLYKADKHVQSHTSAYIGGALRPWYAPKREGYVQADK
jgi:hypothetical protein